MTLATEKTKQASERFMLVRMNPARFIEPTLVSGNTYTSTLPFVVNKIERNGVVLTKVSDTPNADGEWNQDETTGILTLYSTFAPDDTTTIIIAYHYLFYTGTTTRYVYEDPENSATTVREWRPRILSYPNLSQSFDNILSGIFTVSNSTFNLINEDGIFQEHCGVDDTFKNKDIDVWLCINDVENIKKVYTGQVYAINFFENTVTITITDKFDRLKASALLGDRSTECYFTREIGSFPSMFPGDSGKPNPLILGRFSRFVTTAAGFPVGSPPPYDISDGNEAVCTDYSSNISSTNNRQWHLCRSFDGSVPQSIADEIEAVTVYDVGYYAVRIADTTNRHVGDTFSWENPSSIYARICHVGDFVLASVTYNLIIQSIATIGVTDVVHGHPSIAVVILRNGSPYYPMYGRDYTTSATQLEVNWAHKITFNSSMETNVGLATKLNPSTDTVIYRLTLDSTLTHGDGLKTMFERAGYSTNATSFTNADSGLDVNLAFQIPQFDESDFDSYLDYVQLILKSTLGFVKLNADDEIEYHLIAAPVATESRNDNSILDRDFSARIDYGDIVTEIVAYNPHASSVQLTSLTPTPSVTVSSEKAYYLNGNKNATKLRHVLEAISHRLDAHLAVQSLRKCLYSFSTATDDVETELGDSIAVQSDIVLGSDASTDLLITAIDRTSSRTILTGQDLKGL